MKKKSKSILLLAVMCVLMVTANMQMQADPIGSRRKRRVAAYARVSTDHEEQQSSYEVQVDYYTDYINGKDDWEFVSVYADDGITGRKIGYIVEK